MGFPLPSDESGAVTGFALSIAKAPAAFRYGNELAPIVSALKVIAAAKADSELAKLMAQMRISEIKVNLLPYCDSTIQQLLVCSPYQYSEAAFVEQLKWNMSKKK